MATYASAADLEFVIPAETVRQIFDDDLSGTADASTVDYYLDLAQSFVNSYLEQLYAIPLASPVPNLVRHLTIEVAVAFAYRRHPEYVRSGWKEIFEETKTMLQQIRDGKIGLDTEALPTPRNEAFNVSSGNALSPDVPNKVFGDLGDF